MQPPQTRLKPDRPAKASWRLAREWLTYGTLLLLLWTLGISARAAGSDSTASAASGADRGASTSLSTVQRMPTSPSAECPQIRHRHARQIESSVAFELYLEPPLPRDAVIVLAPSADYVVASSSDGSLRLPAGAAVPVTAKLRPDVKGLLLFDASGKDSGCLSPEHWVFDVGLNQVAQLVFDGPGIRCADEDNCRTRLLGNSSAPKLGEADTVTVKLERIGGGEFPLPGLLTVQSQSATCDIQPIKGSAAKGDCTSVGETMSLKQTSVQFKLAPSFDLSWPTERRATFKVVVEGTQTQSLSATIGYSVGWPSWALGLGCLAGALFAAVATSILKASGNWKVARKTLAENNFALLLLAVTMGCAGFILKYFDVLDVKLKSNDLAGYFVVGILLWGLGKDYVLKGFDKQANSPPPPPPPPPAPPAPSASPTPPGS